MDDTGFCFPMRDKIHHGSGLIFCLDLFLKRRVCLTNEIQTQPILSLFFFFVSFFISMFSTLCSTVLRAVQSDSQLLGCTGKQFATCTGLLHPSAPGIRIISL